MTGTYTPEVEALLAQATLTPRETSKVLRVGINQMYAMLREGRIRSLRAGTRYVIPTSAVRELLGGVMTAHVPAQP